MKKKESEIKLVNLKKRKINPYWYDFKKMLKISETLAYIGTNETFALLNSLLNARTSFIRDAAAIVLHDLRDNRALGPLVKAINNPQNRNKRGTLVHALEYLDCKDLFLFMVELALSGEYEVQAHALNILRGQNFRVTMSDIDTANDMINSYLKSGNKCDEYKLLIVELEKYIKKIKKKNIRE